MNPSILPAFRMQADACAQMDSPLYASLITIAADDIERNGLTTEIVGAFDGDAAAAALPLRLMGGLHRLVLDGEAPSLAAHFPSVGGSMVAERLSADYIEVLATRRDELVDSLDVPPQTNETGRSALLFPGLAAAVGDTGLPVHLREIGSSAGLNLVLDLFSYRTELWEWTGVSGAPVLEPRWTGGAPRLPAELKVATRSGCDLSPIDVSERAARTRLLSFIWPDQVARFERARAAIDILTSIEHRLDRADAADWVAHELDNRPEHGLVVVQHSVMWQYVPVDTATSILSTIHEHARSATEERPLAHVRFEPTAGPASWGDMRLIVTRWPGGDERVLARGHAHGAWVDWLGDEDSAT